MNQIFCFNPLSRHILSPPLYIPEVLEYIRRVSIRFRVTSSPHLKRAGPNESRGRKSFNPLSRHILSPPLIKLLNEAMDNVFQSAFASHPLPTYAKRISMPTLRSKFQSAFASHPLPTRQMAKIQRGRQRVSIRFRVTSSPHLLSFFLLKYQVI